MERNTIEITVPRRIAELIVTDLNRINREAVSALDKDDQVILRDALQAALEKT